MRDPEDRQAHSRDELFADRRQAIKALGGTLVLLGCGSSASQAGTGDAATGGTGGAGGDGGVTSCAVTPDETIGPYPDKTGMLTNATYNRRDITEGRAGLTLNVALSIVNTSSACAAVSGASVIIWQCDAEGHYSEYGGQPGGYSRGHARFSSFDGSDASTPASRGPAVWAARVGR